MKATGPTDTSRWMELLEQHSAQKTLRQLFIPGAHDAATAAITADSPWGSGSQELLGKFPKWLQKWLLKLGGKKLKEAVCAWSRAQGMSITAQLNAGIRYFDLRVARHKDNEFYFTHSLLSGRVSAGLSEFADFLPAHPKEIVILDFQHFYSMSPADHDRFASTLSTKFDYKLIERPGQFAPLSSIWAKNQQVVLLYNGDSEGQQALTAHPKFWDRNKSIRSMWCDKRSHSLGDLHDCLRDEVSNYSTLALNVFFVLQGVLSPDAGMIVAGALHGSPRSLKDLAEKYNTAVVGWFENEWSRFPLNILMIDWVEVGALVHKCIELNSGH